MSALQPVERDFAFVVDQAVAADAIARAARAVDRALVSDVRVFDVFAGGSLGDGKKSVAIIAQELQPVLPDCVYTMPTKLQPEDQAAIDLFCYDPTHILFHLVLAVQELERRLKALEAKN